ncbi:MAG: hypothetical protein ACR652_10235 [Methylocystis sp.]|uniref:hypothetical protein n=1 Tax=Methylocystis sp. TaxID=1911079 RepID=UPI003DA58F37
MAKTNKTGRSKGHGRFVQVHEYMMRSYAWSRLSPLARCAWLEINLFFNGSNNGRLAISARALAGRLGVGKSSATRATDELLRWGFLDIVVRSDFHKTKCATEYRLTHLPCDATGTAANKRFMKIASIVGTAEAAE